MNLPRSVSRRHLPTSPFARPVADAPVERYEVNDRVTHDQFGLGAVVCVEPGIAVLVDFGSQRERIVIPCRKLTKL